MHYLSLVPPGHCNSGPKLQNSLMSSAYANADIKLPCNITQPLKVDAGLDEDHHKYELIAAIGQFINKCLLHFHLVVAEKCLNNGYFLGWFNIYSANMAVKIITSDH